MRVAIQLVHIYERHGSGFVLLDMGILAGLGIIRGEGRAIAPDAVLVESMAQSAQLRRWATPRKEAMAQPPHAQAIALMTTIRLFHVFSCIFL